MRKLSIHECVPVAIDSNVKSYLEQGIEYPNVRDSMLAHVLSVCVLLDCNHVMSLLISPPITMLLTLY